MSLSSVNEAMQDVTGKDQTIYIGFVGFTILVWDHLVTSGDEIEFIWKGHKGILVYLFLLNRYLTPLGFIVNLVAYNLPSWSYKSCQHFVRYEGAMTAIGIEIVGLMMLLRVIAMYRHQRAAVVLAVLLLLAWIVVTAWLLTYGGPVIHTDNIHSCTMVFNSGSIASASAWLPLLYDTYVFGLTFNRTFSLIRNKEASHVIRTLFADGLLYYSVICAVNLVLTIMIIRAHQGVKNIAAQLGLLLTVTMMSRITLNLKKEAYYGHSRLHLQAENIIMSTRNHAISTPSGGVVALNRLRSHSVPSTAPVGSRSRARSGSTSSLSPTMRAITFAENPSISATQPHLSAIYSATKISGAQSPVGGSPVIEHADWPSVSNSNEWNTADIV
ncbi:uncharacterized protein BJ212DRAFT_1363681 [Suillus subaureus]|uniref:DUF6533 domain-containing protein n=1 Tax=Suillus subaureus TaxID=48587 RepID=A0A9P7E8K6_9AGAM|nr:uncharacterized protein BJ212DRAFT_1363681 [Suillus subaureus]KAG1814423.1 hypothetical protein BJ212DRAFT_1363681 [Suillus subaureus]